MSDPPPRHASTRPGLVLAAGLLGLAIVASPALVGRACTLEWKAGNLRPVLHGLQALGVVLAVGTWLARGRVSAFYRRVFPTPRHLAFKVGLVAGSMAGAVAAAELVLRLVHFPFEEAWTPSGYTMGRYDPEIGWTYAPGRSHVHRYGDAERQVAEHFDDLGCRVPAPGARRDPARVSVLFVGGSFTMGQGLPYEETFVGRLEAMADFPFQAVNLGVQGYGTDQALLMLKRHFGHFDTRAVVYTFILDHVHRNNNYDRRLLHRHTRFLGTKPLFGLQADGALHLKRRPVRYTELSYSRVWACVRMAWHSRGPVETLDLTRALVREMRSFVEAHGATFILNYWREQHLAGGAPPARLFPDPGLRIVDVAAGAPPEWAEWIIPGDGHPDARAHARVARLLHEEFKRLKLIP